MSYSMLLNQMLGYHGVLLSQAAAALCSGTFSPSPPYPPTDCGGGAVLFAGLKLAVNVVQSSCTVTF